MIMLMIHEKRNVIDDIQLSFLMMNPYYINQLKRIYGKPTYYAKFRAPEKHGVFKFILDYDRTGYSYIFSSNKVPLRPYYHNEFPRFIPCAHPYYVSVFIIFIGGILVITSISKIIYYQSETYNNVLFYVTLGILSCSILLKIFQAYSYNRFSKLISSLTLKANFIDTISDIISTTFIMIALIIDYVLSFNGIIVPFSIDGVLGIVVSLFIIFNGIKLLIEETRPLIGAKFNQKYVDELISVIKSNDKIINYHDIMYHNYGENKCYMTVHLEIDNKYSLDEAHNIADQIEYEVKDKYGIELTSHIDPVNLNDQELADIKNKIITYLNEINENITIHDVRIIRRDNKHLILFDMNTPYDYEDINIKDKITKLFENKYEFKINIEHPYY